MICKATGKKIISGVVDYSRSSNTHFALKTERGIAKYSRAFYISEYELLRVGQRLFEKK